MNQRNVDSMNSRNGGGGEKIGTEREYWIIIYKF